MAMMIRPMHRGSMPFGAPIFLLSVMARMHRIRAPVAITLKTKQNKKQAVNNTPDLFQTIYTVVVVVVVF